MNADAIVRRYRAGESVNALAVAARVYNGKVKRILIHHGVALRTKAEQNRIAGTQKRRRLSEETLRSLYNRYLRFEPILQLAASASVEHRRLKQEFSDRGWPPRSRSAAMAHANRKRCVFSDEEAQELRRRYEANESADDIARAVGTSPSVVRAAVRRVGGVIRDSRDAHRTCELDEHAFDRLSPESTYWLGMLITDGSVSKAKNTGPNRSPTIKLALKRGDRAHIEAFKRFMGSSHKIYDGHGRVEGKICPTSEVGFGSHVLAARLAKWGVTQRKSQTATAHPDLCKSRDFWRGVVDGDGSLGIYRDRGKPGPRLSLGGSEMLMQQFADYCEPLLGHRPTPIPHKKARMWEIRFGGEDTVALARHLYPAACFALSRKAATASAIEQEFGNKVDWKPGPKQPVRDAYFDDRLCLLRAFAAEHGHAEVPAAYVVGGLRLGRWVQRLRDHHRLKLSRLSAERVRLLEDVPGWRWTVGKGRARLP